MQGRLAEQTELVAQVVARQPDSHVFRAALAWAHAETGALDEAMDDLEQLEIRAGADFCGLQRDLQWWATVAGAVVAVCRLGDAARAKPLYELLTPYADRVCTLGQAALYGSVAYFLGLLASTLDRTEEAVAHLHAASDRHDAIGSPPLVALAQSALAAALEARGQTGDAAQAKRLRRQATVVAKTLGMGPLGGRSLSGGQRSAIR
jgi:tetratricopeptide (TPR) repeat protein